MTEALDVLSAGALSALGRALTIREAILFTKYLDLLLKWQKISRLIGSSNPRWIVENLFVDSLLFRRVLPTDLGNLLDLGAGAGVPGLPLKIVSIDLRLTLVESRQRRASFLSTAVRELELRDVTVIGERAESLLPGLAGQFDAVAMRCAGTRDDLLSLGARFIRPGGLVVASGPPSPSPISFGQWVTVPGVVARKTRIFAVYHRP